MTSTKELVDAFVVVAIAAAGVGALLLGCIAFSKAFDIADDEPRLDEPLNGDARACQYAHQHPEIRSKDALLPPPIPFYEAQKRLNGWAGQVDPRNEYIISQMRVVMRSLPPLQIKQVQRKAAAKRRGDDDRTGA
ncbi:MAG: hypothetical protein FPO08_05715 [Geobacter sp.]|nr:MAG: hypothetical protein FPO08_05715 [Geobacter sp.]